MFYPWYSAVLLMLCFILSIFLLVRCFFLLIWSLSIKRDGHDYPINLEKRSKLFKWIEAYRNKTLDNVVLLVQGHLFNDRKLRDYYNELNVIQK